MSATPCIPRELCIMCKQNPQLGLHSWCFDCLPVARICCTSAEEGIKHHIPGASLDELKRASKYEITHSCRRTVIKALDRAIKNFGRTQETPPKI